MQSTRITNRYQNKILRNCIGSIKFVMAERERRLQAEARFVAMDDYYYAQMQSQGRMYYQPWLYQNYLQDFSYHASPVISPAKAKTNSTGHTKQLVK